MAATSSRGPKNLPGQTEADVAKRGIISLNHLDYTLQPDLSVAVTRSYKQHFPQQRKYKPNQRMVVIANSGAEFIDPKTSYLEFTVKNLTPQWEMKVNGDSNEEGNGDATDANGVKRRPGLALGSGSALNFIRRVILSTRSGDEIERVERVNQMNFMSYYTKDAEWFNTIGQAMGFSPYSGRGGYYTNMVGNTSGAYNLWGSNITEDIVTLNRVGHSTISQSAGQFVPWTSSVAPDDTIISTPDGERKFVIPLSEIFGLFRSCDSLLPSTLVSGLRFEIEFEDANVACEAVETNPAFNTEDLRTNFALTGTVYREVGRYLGKWVTNTDNATNYAGLDYEIADPVIVFDQYQLTDGVQRTLNEESALRGLELPFTTFHNTQSSYDSAGSAVHQEVRKAVSRALTVMTKTRSQISGNKNESLTDSFISAPFNRTSWQVRVGSLYFPQQAITGEGATYDPNAKMTIIKEPSAARRSYMHTLHAFGKIRTPNTPCNVSYWDYLGHNMTEVRDPATNIDQSVKRGGMDILAVNLERSSVQKLTGIPINNSRTCEVRAEYDPNDPWFPKNFIVDTWLHHMKLIRVFLQNCEIEE